MPPPFHRRAAGFTLIELLAVVAIIALLSVLVLPSVGMLADWRLTSSGNELADLMTLARQTALSKGVHTVIVVKTKGADAYRAYAALELTLDEKGAYTWQTLNPWRQLYAGAVFFAGAFDEGANFLAASTPPPAPLPAYAYQGVAVDLADCAVVQVYQPDGTLSAGQSLRLRVVKGFPNADGPPRYTGTGNAGSPANYYDIIFLRDTGQTKVERP